MAKHLLRGAILLALLILSGWGIFFIQANFRGIFPAVFSSSHDVADLIRQDAVPLLYPKEFEFSIFAEGLHGPRVITFDPAETMLVSETGSGRVVVLPDTDNNGRADRIIEIVGNLNRPHGIAFSSGKPPLLYIAEKDRVRAYPYDQDTFKVGPPEQVAALPGGGGHSTRTLLYLSEPIENRLLVSVGSSCNACDENDWRRAKILSINTGSGGLRTFASGLRNAVFMTIHPETGDIWATEMGRDYLGDDLPPDEINIIRNGADYGWPSCFGKNIPDTDYLRSGLTSDACRDKTPSFIDIQAHSAPLGLDFFPSQGWPEKYRNNLLVAYHGSWNRTVPTGYKIVLFSFDKKGGLLGREDFVSGWLSDSKSSLGRPVDVKIRPGGVIYISDDKAGIIYRMSLKRSENE